MTTPHPLVAVGKDCDCGNPLVWRAEATWCAVYGSHPPIVTYRRRDAFAARLVDELTGRP